jgi:hypothetical protein
MDYRAFEPFKNFIDDYIIHLKWGASGKLFDLNKHTFGDVAIIKKKIMRTVNLNQKFSKI